MNTLTIVNQWWRTLAIDKQHCRTLDVVNHRWRIQSATHNNSQFQTVSLSFIPFQNISVCETIGQALYIIIYKENQTKPEKSQFRFKTNSNFNSLCDIFFQKWLFSRNCVFFAIKKKKDCFFPEKTAILWILWKKWLYSLPGDSNCCFWGNIS